MPYTLRGSLFGLLCDDCQEPLAGLEIRLYEAARETATHAAVAPEKDTFRPVDPSDAAGRVLLASALIGAGGEFSVTVDADGYDGGPFDVDLYCGTVPRPKVGPRATPRQFTITTLQPRWKQTDGGSLAVWDYRIPSRFWCHILSLFGVWSISGHLRTCDDGSPIVGATVSAFDRDWLQDDPLGSATTDGNGHFLITYLTEDFRRTPWSPLVNIELVGGPDVYFKAVLGGDLILNEPPSTGRTPGRENVGPCLCVNLCSKVVDGGVENQPHWQSLDDFDIHPAPGQPLSLFAAEGYAGDSATEAYVFGGQVSLQGNCPVIDQATGKAFQYRFRIGEYGWTTFADDPDTMPTVVPTVLEPLTAIVNTKVGWVSYADGNGVYQSADVWVGPADVLPDGWIKLDGKTVTVPMNNPPGATAVVAVTPTNFLRSGELFMIDTTQITPTAKLPPGLPRSEAGRSLTPAEREPIRRYRLVFEVRDENAPALYATDELSSVVFDNSAVITALDLEELYSNACNPLAGRSDVHILYTIDHPHLRSFSIEIDNNGGPVHTPPDTPSGQFTAGAYFFRGDASGPHNLTNTGGVPVSVAGDGPCAYSVNLGWTTRRVIDGYPDSWHTTQVLYCK